MNISNSTFRKLDNTRRRNAILMKYSFVLMKGAGLGMTLISGIIPGMGSANERRRYIVTSSLIGWTHNQTIPVS